MLFCFLYCQGTSMKKKCFIVWEKNGFDFNTKDRKTEISFSTRCIKKVLYSGSYHVISDIAEVQKTSCFFSRMVLQDLSQ